MLRAPESPSHRDRLRSLAADFRRQERWMTQALAELQEHLEKAHRDTFVSQLDGDPGADSMVTRCQDMQLECDELATELVHVRMAIAGADEELAAHRGIDAIPRQRRA